MNDIFDYLDELFPNPHCELEYNNDFEFLISVVLSAQTTDKKVNLVTKKLFNKYDMNTLLNADLKELEGILKPLGMAKKKAIYIKNISQKLNKLYNGIVPNSYQDLIKLDGVGRKTANLILSTLYNEPYFAVDTHVSRVSKRLGLVPRTSNVLQIEKKMYKLIPKDRINRTHHQLVLFGRYFCKSMKPACNKCKLYNICKNESKI
ncbi:MAG: endonuclease III [Bacilli bacterium]|nr:endonuclease III [Bacilli bacterium]